MDKHLKLKVFGIHCALDGERIGLNNNLIRYIPHTLTALQFLLSQIRKQRLKLDAIQIFEEVIQVI